MIIAITIAVFGSLIFMALCDIHAALERIFRALKD